MSDPSRRTRSRRLASDETGSDVLPIMPLRLTPAVKAGADGPPTCEHGRWQFAGSDYKRKAAKWRCPTKECKPGSRWIKASRLHTLIPRDSDRWRKLYRGRAAVEREFGRLEARMEPADHPRARYRAGPATRRPDDPRQARLRPRQGASRTAHGVAVRSRTYAWSAVLHPALHSPLQGSASARPVDQPVSKECSGTNAELPMSTPSFANRFANPS